MEITQQSNRFINFAEHECKGSSPLYEYLSLKISEDKDLLELSSHAKEGQPIPNLFLGAVHYLLQSGFKHPLKEYYPSLVKQPLNLEGIFPHFKNFCLAFKSEVLHLLQTKRVQTNEVRRSAYLYPSFCYMYDKVKKPLSLIEIGTSAGLQLLWDQYCYSYGDGHLYGKKTSKLQIYAEIRGELFPSHLENIPPVVSKVGLDLHVCDITDPENELWLRSLIWPEHQDRVKLFEKAAQLFSENPVNLIEGDGVSLLYDIAKQTPEDSAICIFHTHVANQMPEQLKHELINIVKKLGTQRDVFHLYNNMWDRKLHLDSYLNGGEEQLIIGETDGHGRWFEWGLH
ncbi:DUF2332 domain-containing protein [Lederbergia wuyishanensis]|uniref:DUF2332 domain-containing protein n=1 Tax=Lederbergia wuyishanensis TaxID=1347903 RepID=A0ABU0D640_9BACI|nr:DUF2332 domain-containing protein [Lederbergia wuyishanensis]MCJ8008721.1 DUF2332 domain-containing protein [Lederbergia wuyishanensis]MDQ0343859.1 hypothetical protein [Lederbergia wuyishanensis]